MWKSEFYDLVKFSKTINEWHSSQHLGLAKRQDTRCSFLWPAITWGLSGYKDWRSMDLIYMSLRLIQGISAIPWCWLMSFKADTFSRSGRISLCRRPYNPTVSCFILYLAQAGFNFSLMVLLQATILLCSSSDFPTSTMSPDNPNHTFTSSEVLINLCLEHALNI